MAPRYTGVKYDLIARDSASKVFRTVGNSAARLDGGMGRLAKSVAYAGAALAGTLAAGLVVSADKAVHFQSAMKQVQTQAGGTAKDVAVLSRGVLDLAKSAQQGPQALAESMYHLKSVGLDNASALKDLKVASDLAAVGGSDLEETTNALAGAWRSGIRGADTFSKAAATVNAVIGAGNMKMTDFVAAIGTGILPAAKTFGLSLSQVGGALALMTDEGIGAEEAATRLKMSFSLLGAPSAAAEKQLAKIHLTGLQLSEAMRGPQGLIGAIGLLKDHLDKSGLSASRQAQILSRAFGGGRSSSAILTLINNYDVLRKKQDQVNASMGKFPAAVAAQRKTAEAQLKILLSNLDVFAIEVGTKLLPPLTSFVMYLNKTVLPDVGRFSNALMNMVPVGQIEAGFSAVTGFVSDFFAGLSPKKPVITLPSPTIKAPATTIPNDLRRPDLIVPSPTVRVGTTAIPSTVKAPAAVKSQATKLGEQLRGLISGGIGDAVAHLDWGKLGKQLGDGLGTAFQWITRHGADLSKKIAKAIGSIDWVNVGKTVGTLLLPMVIGMTTSMFQPLFTGDFWKKHWMDALVAAVSVLPVSDVVGAVGKGFGKLPWGKLGQVLDRVPWSKIFAWPLRIGGSLGDALAAAGRFVSRLAGGFTDAFSRRFPAVAAWFGRELGLLPTRLGLLGLRLTEQAGKLVKSFGEGLVKHVPFLGNGFVKAVLRVLGRFTFYQTGINLVQGLLSGVGRGMSGIGRWINAHMVHPFVTWVKSLFGVHSPSTVFAAIGRDLVAGLKSGVLGAIAGVGKWLYGHVVSPVLGAFSGAGSWLYRRGRWVVDGLMNGVTSVAKGIGDWVTNHVAQPIIGAFSGAGSWLYHKGLDVMSGLLSGLQNGFSNVSGYLSGLGGTIKRALGNAAGGLGGGIGKFLGLASGGVAPVGTTAWVGEKGPELMQVTSRGTRIYSNRDSMALAGAMGVQLPGYASGTVPAAQGRVTEARDALARARERRIGIKAAETRLKAAEQELANARRATRLAVSNALQNGFLKSLETGTAAGIASAIKSMNTKLQAAGAGSLVAGNLRISARLQTLANQRASIQSRIATARQYASDQSAGLGDFLSITGTGATSISDLVAEMRTGQSTASRFAREVQSLAKRGLSKTLLSELTQAGPGSQLATVLAGASAGDIRTLNKMAASQQKLTTSFGRTMADAMYDSGKDAGRGFLSGLIGQEKQIQAEMDRLAAGMVNAIKKRLGIHSPSTVTRDQIGKPFVLGAAVGVRQYAPHATREAQRMADTMAAVRARSGAAGRPTTGRTATDHRPDGGQFTGRLYLDSGHFLGVVHGLVEPMVREGVEQGHMELTAALRAGGVE